MKKDLAGRFGLASLYSLISLLWSCSEEVEAPKNNFTQFPLTVTHIEERFDPDGNIFVKAAFNTLEVDSITSYGFVFTDGFDGVTSSVTVNVDPKLGTHHVKEGTILNAVGEPAKGEFSFDALINPERNAPIFAVNAGVVNVAAYLKSKSGRTIMSKTEIISAARPMINMVYPLAATAGSLIKIDLNRKIEDGAMVGMRKTNAPGERFPVTIIIADKPVAIESVENLRVTVKMPPEILGGASLILRVGEYEYEYKDKVLNSDLGFELLTEFNRTFSGRTLIFAINDRIYFGGGTVPSTNTGLKDFWAYDQTSKTWGAIADLPSDGLGRGMAFVVDGKAYCGTPNFLDQYDPAANSWKRLAKPTTTLQYDQTFGPAASVVYNSKVYFTNFDRVVTVGVTYHNFHEFDAASGLYKILGDYPGPDLFSDYQDKGAVFNNVLHFFPGIQHWTYNTTTNLWQQLKDFPINGITLKPFTIQNKLYTLYINKEVVNFTPKITAKLFKYNTSEDSWSADADIPLVPNTLDLYQVAFGNDVYICITANNPTRIIVYRVV